MVVEVGGFFGVTVACVTNPECNQNSSDYKSQILANEPISFPKLMCDPVGGISVTDNTDFTLPSIGIYRITWHVTTNESSNLCLRMKNGSDFEPLGDTDANPSKVGQGLVFPPLNNPTYTYAQVNGDVLIKTTIAGSIIRLYNESPYPITIMGTVAGSYQAPALIIHRVA